MTGSGECWSGDCDHDEHLADFEKIEKLKEFLLDAIEADPSKHVLGVGWHEDVEKLLKLL